MKPLRTFGPLLALLAYSPPAAAAIQPSFHLDHCAWWATHIVVVTEGEKIDGAVEILESWKGDLNQGDRLTLPELAAFAPEKARAISKGLFREDKALPASVTCSRMVLFLVREQEKAGGDGPGNITWRPVVSWGGMKVSMAWVEKDKVFAFTQEHNPGPSLLIPWGMNECELKCRVDDILATQTALAEAMRQDDPAKLASAIPPLLRSDSDYVRGTVVGSLWTGGAKSLPALRGVLKDESLWKLHETAVWALAKAGGAAVGPELTELLKRELAFWKTAGPGLKAGWWNGAGIKWDEVERLRHHCGMAHTALGGLKAIRHAGCREAVTELRDFWRSLPQLAEIDQLAKDCDAVLEELRRP
jgi:hypothetical protein